MTDLPHSASGKIKFSIIIPTYNRGTLIKGAIDSALNQAYTDFEIIVVDDGSTDHTKEQLKEINDERFHYHFQVNSERGRARNMGISVAKGDYVTFLDSDDELYSRHLEEAVKLVSEKGTPEIFHLSYDNVYPDGRKVNSNVPPNINDALLKGNCLSTNGIFIRKDIAVQFPFCEDRRVAGSEDYLLWLTLGARYKIHHSPAITSSVLQHDERSVLNTNAEALIIRKKLMLQYLFEDPVCDKAYHKSKASLTADAYLLIALHIALSKREAKTGIQFLFRAILCDFKSVTKRQFWGTIKNLVI